MNIFRRLSVPVLAVALLAGCESRFNVDVAVSSPEALERLEVRVLGVDLLEDDGGVVSVDADDPGLVDLLENGPDVLHRLIGDADVPERHYRGLRLRLDERDGEAQFDSGPAVPVGLSTTQPFMPIDLRVRRDETSDAVLVLDLRFSVADRRSSSGGVVLQQAGTAADAERTGAIAGNVDETVVGRGECAGVNSGYALYLFRGERSTVNDFLEESADSPVRSATLNRPGSSGDFSYRFIEVPEGRYTLAFTCQADLDDPFTREALVFRELSAVEVSPGDETRKNFD